MRTRHHLTVALAALGFGLAGAGQIACNDVSCGSGTIERNGACAPADDTVGSAQCGTFTELVADTCVPEFPPAVCDPATTTAVTDPTTGVTTCMGEGSASGCSAPLACPTPDTGKQTICGQLYNLIDLTPFADTGATGATCTAGSASGPCAVGIAAVDAATGTMLSIGSETIDDCGRYIVADIGVASAPSPVIGLALDDANPANAGPLGVTEATAVSTFKTPNVATQNLDAFVVPPAQMWSGGPAITGGIYAMIFFAHKTGFVPQPGVTVTKNGATIPTLDSYFVVTDVNRTTVDAAATFTNANGTALISSASPADGLAYSGSGGLQPGCAWPSEGGTTQMFVIDVQELRPTDASGMTCSQ
jgi:hypothetical protein